MKYLLLTMLFLVVGCSSIQPGKPVEEEQPVSIFTGKPGGIKLSDLSGTESSDGAFPINAIAWRAALDIASLLPLADVDTFGGSIVTEWYSLPDKPGERIKLTIFVVGRELRSDSVSVRVHVQKRTAAGWSDAARDEDFARRVEELILTRARELRADAVAETAD